MSMLCIAINKSECVIIINLEQGLDMLFQNVSYSTAAYPRTARLKRENMVDITVLL